MFSGLWCTVPTSTKNAVLLEGYPYELVTRMVLYQLEEESRPRCSCNVLVVGPMWAIMGKLIYLRNFKFVNKSVRDEGSPMFLYYFHDRPLEGQHVYIQYIG